MKVTKVIHLGTVLALGLTPAAALADEHGTQGHGQPSNPPSTAGQGAQSTGGLSLQGPRPNLSEMRHGRSIRVNDVYTGQTQANCTYRATVSGNIQEWLPHAASQGAGTGQPQGASASPAPGETVYVPHLRVNAQLQCPDRAVQRSTTAAIDGTPLTRHELERIVSDLAVVPASAADRTCLYTSEFTFANDRLSGRSLAQRCMPGVVGGGPSGHSGQSESGSSSGQEPSRTGPKSIGSGGP